MKLSRVALQKIAGGHKATAAEVSAMTHELIALRDEQERRDGGTTPVRLEHVGESGIKGWFEPTAWRIPTSHLHTGARVTLQGRVYSVVSIEGEDERVVRVR